MKAKFKRFQSTNTRHLDKYQILVIFEQLYKYNRASEKSEILFEILKEVKDLLTYERLSNKQYHEFPYKNILDKNYLKESLSNSKKEKSATYAYLPF